MYHQFRIKFLEINLYCYQGNCSIICPFLVYSRHALHSQSVHSPNWEPVFKFFKLTGTTLKQVVKLVKIK